MKKLMFTTCVVLGLLIMVAAEAPADTIVVTQGPLSSGNGGVFYAATSANGSFLTFCLETGEYFSPGQTYNYTISSAAILGGTSSSDPISIGTAYLYRGFVDGTIVIDTAAKAGALQNTIWWLEGEGAEPADTNIYKQLVENLFLNPAADASVGAYGIYVMNLTGPVPATTLAQDMLVAVPEPGILILLGIAMSAIGAASWRIRKR
jgi:hypothetical protein